MTNEQTRPEQAPIALGESERQFRLLVHGVTDYAIYMLDVNGHTRGASASRAIRATRSAVAISPAYIPPRMPMAANPRAP